MTTLNEYMATKETVFGVFAKTNDPLLIEIIGRSGFDFVILDNEHGPNSPRDTYNLITAAEASGIYPVVRVPKLDAAEIQRSLDLGPAGVQVPQIQCRKDAENVVAFSKFHPQGRRGLCGHVRAANFSLPTERSFYETQNELTTVIHIEGTEGILALDEIVEVDGIDVVFIGPCDLSQSLGLPGQIEHPRVLREIEKIVKKCRNCEKNLGIFASTIESARRYKGMKVKYIGCSTDIGIFANGCSALADELNRL